MGFPLVCYCLPIPKPVIAFCQLLSAIRDAVLLILAIVGLCSFPPPDNYAARGGSADARRQPEEVKSRLPAVEYTQLLAESSLPAASSACQQQCRDDHGGGGEDDDASACCIVCLEALVAADEVWRLGNCAHAFHRTCIDRWIDIGRATCPLCRSDLLPLRPRAVSSAREVSRPAARALRRAAASSARVLCRSVVRARAPPAVAGPGDVPHAQLSLPCSAWQPGLPCSPRTARPSSDNGWFPLRV